jgi:lipopolysaccharide export system protein LptA
MYNRILSIILIGFAIWANPGSLYGQEEESADQLLIEIINTDLLVFQRLGGRELQRLIGNVVILHDSSLFFCDSAYYYQIENRFEAFDHVRVEFPDSAVLTSERMDYDGDNRIVKAYQDVLLQDSVQDVELRTDILTFYRNKRYGTFVGGGELTNGENTLTSELGYYYPDQKMAFFRENVVLKSPDYDLFTDTLAYNTETKIANFVAATRIQSGKGEILTSKGSYLTRSRLINFLERTSVKDSNFLIIADTLFYDDIYNFGEARGNVVLIQKDSSLTVRGDYGEFDRKLNTTLITRNAVAVQTFDSDTLYVFADTLVSYLDTVEVEIAEEVDTVAADSAKTLKKVYKKEEKRIFRAYHDVEIVMNEMQGRADSLVYLFSDSVILFYEDPVLWSDQNQLTGDTIKIWMANEQADSMWVGPGGFVVSQEDTIGFNQIKGRELRAKFRENELYRLHVIGNSESIYFTKNDEGGYEGMNKALSQEMLMYLDSGEVIRIKFDRSPEGTFDPIYLVLQQENKLEGMQWRPANRPVQPAFDLFGRPLRMNESSKNQISGLPSKAGPQKQAPKIKTEAPIQTRDQKPN